MAKNVLLIKGRDSPRRPCDRNESLSFHLASPICTFAIEQPCMLCFVVVLVHTEYQSYSLKWVWTQESYKSHGNGAKAINYLARCEPVVSRYELLVRKCTFGPIFYAPFTFALYFPIVNKDSAVREIRRKSCLLLVSHPHVLFQSKNKITSFYVVRPSPHPKPLAKCHWERKRMTQSLPPPTSCFHPP